MTTYQKYNKKAVNDDFKTPMEVWSNIEQYIPDKTIWCPFYYNGEHTLQDLGYNIIHQDEDFFTYEPDYDLVIDNTPFSIKRQVLERLFNIDKPFILILPVSTICYKYFKIYKDKIQLIIPPHRYNFHPEKNSSATFDCVYVCYKMNLDRDIIFL